MIKLKNILRESPNAAADDTIIKISDAIIAEVANSKSFIRPITLMPCILQFFLSISSSKNATGTKFVD